MNIQRIIYILLVCIALGACTKDEQETVNETVNTTGSKVLYTGDFMSEVHTTSGKISVLEYGSGKKSLYIENLKSDNGPDLRLYVAEDKRALNAIEIVAKPKNGTYELELSQSIDFTKQKYVLIWCKQYTVLFGSARLKG